MLLKKGCYQSFYKGFTSGFITMMPDATLRIGGNHRGTMFLVTQLAPLLEKEELSL